jgi:hypothetical protein
MNKRIVYTIIKALACIREWEKDTDLNTKQITTIEELRDKIYSFGNSDIWEDPLSEFQKLSQLRYMFSFHEEIRNKLKEIDPQNVDLYLLSCDIYDLLDKIYMNYDHHLGKLPESARKEFFKNLTPATKTIDEENKQEETPDTKTIDKEKQLYEELVKALKGRKELADELLGMEYKDVLRHWCNTHSKFLNQKPRNVAKLYRIIIELGNIKESFSYEAFNLWVRGK